MVCFQSRESGLLMHAFITFVRPILEYCSVVWSLGFKKDIVRIEAVQRGFTKRLSGFSKLSYEQRLASLNCESLYSRRVKCDLVMCYQMLIGSVNIDTNAFFTRKRRHCICLPYTTVCFWCYIYTRNVLLQRLFLTIILRPV